MLKIKEHLFERSDPVQGCCGVFSLAGELLRQVEAIERVIQALDREEVTEAIAELDWYENSCLLSEDEQEVQALATELQGHPELAAEDEKDRLLAQERLFYNRSQKFCNTQNNDQRTRTTM